MFSFYFAFFLKKSYIRLNTKLMTLPVVYARHAGLHGFRKKQNKFQKN